MINTKSGLPIVSADTINTISDTLNHNFKTNHEFILNYGDKYLKKVNPMVHHFITKWFADIDDEETWVNAVMGALLLYKLLENQAEVDELEESFG